MNSVARDRLYTTLARGSGVLLVVICVLFQRRGDMHWTELLYVGACVGLLEVYSRTRGLRRARMPMLFVYSLMPLALVLFHGSEIRSREGDFVQMVLSTPLPLVLVTVQVMVLYVRDSARLVSVVLVLALFSVVIGVRRPLDDAVWPWLAVIGATAAMYLMLQHPGMLFSGVYVAKRRGGPAPSGKPGGIVRGSFFSVVPLFSMTVLVAALALYFALPRFSAPPGNTPGIEVAQNPVITPEPTPRPTQPRPSNHPVREGPASVSGLADGVELGDFGEIMLSDEHALSVQLVAPVGVQLDRIYLRAFNYGTFDGWRWEPLVDPEYLPVDVPAGTRRILPGAPRSSAIGWTNRRYLITLGEAGRGAGGQLPLPVEPQVIHGYRGPLTYDRLTHTAAAPEIQPGDSYTVEANQLIAPEAQLRRLLGAAPPSLHPRLEYTQLPPGMKAEIQQRFGFYERYAGMIDGREPGGRRGVYDAALDIVTMFREATSGDARAWSYSLNFRPRSGFDAIVRFLDTKTNEAERYGHCEYFATAMCVLMRCYGVPARVVAGFTAKERNDAGVFDVRAKAAHAWVEVYFENYGWLTFDPTPPEIDTEPPPTVEPEPEPDEPEPVVTEAEKPTTGRDFFNEYDREAQREMFNDAAAFVQETMESADRGLAQFTAWMPEFLPRNGLLRALMLVVPAVALTLWLLLRRRKRKKIEARVLRQMGGGGDKRQRGLYMQLLLLLARYGFQKRASETPREFANRVLRRGGNQHQLILELTETYYALRFGSNDELEAEFKLGLGRYADALRERQSGSSSGETDPQPA
jgi:hypothetical protein